MNKTFEGGEAMEAKEMQVWKEKLEKARALLSKVWDFAYRYRVEFDVEVKGRECKLVVYQEKDGKMFMALTKEAYEKAVELAESEDRKLREAARAVLNYVKMFSELWKAWKVRAILQWAKDLPGVVNNFVSVNHDKILN
jgi:galactose-1-phosphate uridylyltransferase